MLESVQEHSCTVGGNADGYSYCGEQYGGSLKTKHTGTVWSSNPTSGIHPEKIKTLIWKDLCTSVFIAALFTTAKT